MKDSDREWRCKTIAIAVTAREKAAFLSFCEQRNLLPSQMLRLMFVKVCPEVVDTPVTPERTPKHAPLHLTLPHEDAAAVRDKAAQEGTTPQGWIRRLIRTTLHQEPQFSRDEENALTASNRELAHLGRTVNQIARTLSEADHGNESPHATVLASLARTIDEHRTKVAALINASWGRYGGKGRS